MLIASCMLLAAVNYEVVRGIEYRDASIPPTNPELVKEMCVADLMYPKNKPGFPTLVWFHGGGLTAGNRHFVTKTHWDLDYAQVAVEYRLMSETNTVRGADCLEDAAAAVAWTLKNIEKFGGDPKKVFVAGSSAGGYLTMMVGMDPRWLKPYGFKPTDLAGLAPNSGQATKHFGVKSFAGDNRGDAFPVIDELAPLYYVKEPIPPIVLITGQSPWEIPARAEENRLLAATLKAFGKKDVWYIELPYASHGRTMPGGIPYIEQMIGGKLPEE